MEYNSRFNGVFEENLQSWNEFRFPRHCTNIVQNADLIYPFSDMG